MDDNRQPPLRISISSVKNVSKKTVKSHIDAFLINYDRIGTRGEDTTVTTQLLKLKDALGEKAAKKKERRGINGGGHDNKE
jgi:hypothetical protein